MGYNLAFFIVRMTCFAVGVKVASHVASKVEKKLNSK